MAEDLTAKQRRFVEEYLIDLNASKAALRAGYSPDTVGAIGWENLQKPEIIAALEVAMEERSKRTEITADRVLAELGKVGFSDMARYAQWGANGVVLTNSGELSEDESRCVAEVSQVISKDGGAIKFKLHDKVSALEKIARHLGMFVDKTIQVTVPVDAEKLKALTEIPQEDLEAAIALGEKLAAALAK